MGFILNGTMIIKSWNCSFQSSQQRALQWWILTGLVCLVSSARPAHGVVATSFLASFHLSENGTTHYEQTLSASVLSISAKHKSNGEGKEGGREGGKRHVRISDIFSQCVENKNRFVLIQALSHKYLFPLIQHCIFTHWQLYINRTWKAST